MQVKILINQEVDKLVKKATQWSSESLLKMKNQSESVKNPKCITEEIG